MDLSQFNHRDKSLFDAATHLFEQLKIPLNSITTESMTIENVLKNHCKENDTYKAVINTHFLGLIDDSVFSPKTLFSSQNYTYPEALEKANEKYEGFMLFAVELKKYPKRTEIAELTRAFNRLSLKMPVTLLLKYPPTSLLEGESFISIALSERFKYLQNWRQGEKVGKVIILRDIHTRKPHAGHLRILQDLSAPAEVKDFNALHKHWLRVLDVEILNKKFFRELSNWYFAAMNEVSFPDDVEKDPEVRNATNLIRLLTRIIFIWFIKEKGLVPEWLFKKEKIAKILKDFLKDKNAHNYYNAILQ
ncbi:MAG: hypothetical protein N2645_05390, partial [Clostridia bacterium]|nr:hypothetical protein [Clostridia bacterium]